VTATSNKNADQEIGEKAERQQEGLLKPNEKKLGALTMTSAFPRGAWHQPQHSGPSSDLLAQ